MTRVPCVNAVLLSPEIWRQINSYQPGTYLDFRQFRPFSSPCLRSCVYFPYKEVATIDGALQPWLKEFGVRRLSRLFKYNASMLDVALLHSVSIGNTQLASYILKTYNPGVDSLVDIVACQNQESMLHFLTDYYPQVSCSTNAMDWAASRGHVNVLDYLHRIRNAAHTEKALRWAAYHGHLEVIQFFHAIKSCFFSRSIMDIAAGNGHLELVQYLHRTRSEGCTVVAMNEASRGGYLTMVQWLHDHRQEGCTTDAMDKAAEDGYLDVVQFLHENRTEGCTTAAIDWAATWGHLDVVKYLHAHGKPCTAAAMDGAAENGHLDVVQWLHSHRTEGCTFSGMDQAAIEGHEHVIEWLHLNREEAVPQMPWTGQRWEVISILCRSCIGIVTRDARQTRWISPWLESTGTLCGF
ncbi:hypothetical protein AeMF1_019831 [Aphanomyces euteiches]|nr:hypothetical protein AeMF1_019831 [Aphanomyces euteiches]KAH9187745.1 hypothetical protein AeNC1_010281 [Aphanomyces euteiches]